jgi:hypothetical protein
MKNLGYMCMCICVLCFEGEGTCEEEGEVEEEGADDAHDDVNPVPGGGWVMMDRREGGNI